MKKYILFCLLWVVLGQTPVTLEARDQSLRATATGVMASKRFQSSQKQTLISDGYEADDESEEKATASKAAPSRFARAGRAVVAVGRLGPTPTKVTAPSEPAASAPSIEAVPEAPKASSPEAALGALSPKEAEEKKAKEIDGFLKDEQKIKTLLQKITDGIGNNLITRPLSQADVNKNPQAAVLKLQEVYSYYYSGFMSSEVHEKVENWIKDLLEKIDQTFTAKAQQNVVTAT